MSGHPCCGGPHTAQERNPLGHSVGCENYGAGAGEGVAWFGGLKQRPGDQPLPVVNDAPDIQSQVIADIEARRQVGISRYGTALQPHNGRDALQDAYEEAIDLAMYLKQLIVENTDLRAAIEEVNRTHCGCISDVRL